MRVALIPMSAKPFHAGHDGLIQLAAGECDRVIVFVSLKDRARKGELVIRGSDMEQIWRKIIAPGLPGNVEVTYAPVTPIRSLYESLETAEKELSPDVFVIYSDVEDIKSYTDKTLSKSAPELFARKQIELRGVERGMTVDVSGTKMREYLSKGNDWAHLQFVSHLPASWSEDDKDKVWEMLRAKQTST